MAAKLHSTIFPDAWILEWDPFVDQRGLFTRTFCATELAERGLVANFVQHSMSNTRYKGTIRGMHFQTAPHEEVKLVRCLHGEIHDVIVDLRPRSPTFKRWQAFTLSRDNRRQLYVPKGFAHGFQALTDDVDVNYLISEFYAPTAAAGVRFDDAAFGIDWPLPVTMISDRDKSWPDFA